MDLDQPAEISTIAAEKPSELVRVMVKNKLDFVDIYDTNVNNFVNIGMYK